MQKTLVIVSFMSTLYAMDEKYKIHWKDKRRFSQCDCCSDLSELSNLAGTHEEKEALRWLKKVHIEEMRNERFHAMTLEMLAKHFPEQYILLMNDRMTQDCLAIPRMYRDSKLMDDKRKLQIHLVHYILHFNARIIFFLAHRTD